MTDRSHRAPRRPWALLLGALALLVVAAPVPAADAATSLPGVPSTPGPETSEEASVADQVFVLLNAARVNVGLAPLVRNAVLDDAARDWNAHMAQGLCPPAAHWPLCHQSRTALSAMARAAAAPFSVRSWAENVQYTWERADKAHRNFMGSSGHRANMLSPSATMVGIGVTILSSGVMFLTEEFVGAKSPPVVNPCGKVTVTLRLKSKGTAVKRLQCALTAAGVYAGGQSGKFDLATKAAVIAYQQAHGLKATGIADRATRKSMHLTT